MRECCIQLFAQSMENFQFTYSLNWKFWKIHLLIYQIGNIWRFSFMLSKWRYYQIYLHFVKVKINTKLHLPLLPLPRIASNFPLTSFNVYKSLPITTFSWRNYSPSEYIQTNRHMRLHFTKTKANFPLDSFNVHKRLQITHYKLCPVGWTYQK